ncbi:TIGR03767 family metallophosphoesterase, partial [Streptomyces broussonetiae]
MSRIRSVATSALGVNRRTVLAAAGAVSLSAGIGYALRPTDSEAATDAQAPVADSGQASAAGPLAPYTKGTTLASVAAPQNSSGYCRLGDGPGWKRVVRSELAAPKSGRASRRTTLAAFVQFTDLHLQDVQHPLRLEYLRSNAPHAWRPHEALTVPGAISLVERVNA